MTKVRGLALGTVVLALALAGSVWKLLDRTRKDEAPPIEVEPPPASAPKYVRPTVTPEVVEGGIVDRPGVPFVPDWSAGEVPADQLERGDATLRLRLVGDRDGQPVAMDVRLWRLGVAENDTWTEGDEIRSKQTVSAAGEVIERLPRGRYRVQCLDLREEAEDPPEFVVNAGVNGRIVSVANRREFRLRARIVDESGAPRRSVLLAKTGRGSGRSRDDRFPDWATAREAKSGWRRGLLRVVHSACGPLGRLAAVTADADGYFELPSFREPGRRDRDNQEFLLRTDDEMSALLWADSSIDADSTFLWMVPSVAAVTAHVQRPDGGAIDLSSGHVHISSEPVRLAWDLAPDAWRKLPVRVTVVVPGLRPLTFTWTAATAGERRVLLPESRR